MDDQTFYDLFDSLKREMKQESDAVRQEFRQEMRPVRDALERIEMRLSRQGSLIQGGTRQVSRLAIWSEDIDQLLADRDARIEDLTRRVERLEGKEPRSSD